MEKPILSSNVSEWLSIPTPISAFCKATEKNPCGKPGVPKYPFWQPGLAGICDKKRTYSLSCCPCKEQSVAGGPSQRGDPVLVCLAHSSASLSINSSSDFLLKVSVEEQQNNHQLWSSAMESPNIPHVQPGSRARIKIILSSGFSGPWQATKHWLQAKKPRWNLEGS